MEFSVKVEKGVNGYLMRTEDGLHVFEIDPKGEEFESEQRAFLNLVFTLQECFGVHNSKHNKTRLACKIVNTETGEDL